MPETTRPDRSTWPPLPKGWKRDDRPLCVQCHDTATTTYGGAPLCAYCAKGIDG